MSDQPLNVFERVTQKIVDDLARGVRPWQKPWSHQGGIVRPRRHTGEPYNGVNVLLLWDAALERGYCNPTWMTFKQAEDYGAHVRRGEKASFIVYASKVTKVETDEKTGAETERQIPFLRGYHVFNAEQIDGLPERFLAPPATGLHDAKNERLEHVDRFIANTGAVVLHGGNTASYRESSDDIRMPLIEAFRDAESYYATLTHETIHWTKHGSRMARDFGGVVRGDEGYAKEELVAEIGAAFLCADLGITPEPREDHAAYIGHWLQALKNDKRLIFMAAAHATRAVECLKARQPAPAPKPDKTDVKCDAPSALSAKQSVLLF